MEQEINLSEALQKGIEAHKAGKAEEADRYYTAILKTQPKHPDANHNMGVLAVGIGKVNDALPFFVTALEVNPSVAQFWLSYIDALIKLNKATEAKSILDKAKQHGANGDALDNIEEKLQKLLPNKKQPLNKQEPPQDQIQLLINLYTQGQIQKLPDKTSKLLEQYPNSSVLYNIKGTAQRGLGNLDEAINAYEKAIEIKPDYASAYNNMGNAMADQGKNDDAINAYKKAVEIKPDYANAYNNMGIAFQKHGETTKAIEAYNEAISIWI